jgi:hypothetical protein
MYSMSADKIAEIDRVLEKSSLAELKDLEWRLKDRLQNEPLDPDVAHQLRFTLNWVERAIISELRKAHPNAKD